MPLAANFQIERFVSEHPFRDRGTNLADLALFDVAEEIERPVEAHRLDPLHVRGYRRQSLGRGQSFGAGCFRVWQRRQMCEFSYEGRLLIDDRNRSSIIDPKSSI